MGAKLLFIYSEGCRYCAAAEAELPRLADLGLKIEKIETSSQPSILEEYALNTLLSGLKEKKLFGVGRAHVASMLRTIKKC